MADICRSLALTDHADLYWRDARIEPAYPRPSVTRRLTLELFNYVAPPPLETLFGNAPATPAKPASAKPASAHPEPAKPESAPASSESADVPRRHRSLKDYMSDPNCLPDIMRPRQR